MTIDRRPDRDEVLMTVAALFAKRSTCSRLHVGAVFSKDGRILVTGYNGAPSGMPHCYHGCDCSGAALGLSDHAKQCNSQQPCTRAEHAERNAIAWAARSGVKLEGSELHVTHMPCLPCAMSLINAGVESVHYRESYRLTDGVDLLRSAGIQLANDFGRVVI